MQKNERERKGDYKPPPSPPTGIQISVKTMKLQFQIHIAIKGSPLQNNTYKIILLKKCMSTNRRRNAHLLLLVVEKIIQEAETRRVLV